MEQKTNITPKKKIFDLQLLLRIFSFAKPYSGRFYLSATLAVLLALVAPIRPILINETLKKTSDPNSGQLELVMQFLLVITIIFEFFVLLLNLSIFVRIVMAAKLLNY